MRTITVGELARRFGVTRWCAWRWSRKGRFGWPVDATAKIWRWRDDDALAAKCAEITPHRGNLTGSPTSIWSHVEREHTGRLLQFANGQRVTDDEDLELASMILQVAARRFARRAEGLRSPALGSAIFVSQKVLARARMGKADIPDRLLGTAATLLRRVESADSSDD